MHTHKYIYESTVAHTLNRTREHIRRLLALVNPPFFVVDCRVLHALSEEGKTGKMDATKVKSYIDEHFENLFLKPCMVRRTIGMKNF